MDRPLPTGLSFAYLKGSISLLDRVLDEEKPIEQVQYAEAQLSEAVELFHEAIDNLEPGNFMDYKYRQLGRILLGQR